MKKTIDKTEYDNLTQKIQITSFSVVLIILTLFNLTYYLSKPKVRSVLGAQADQNSVLIFYWKNFLSYQPSYIDGWIRLAEIEYNANNTKGAIYALQRAGKIDPSSEKVKVLGRRLG